MDFEPLHTVAWYERGIALASAVSMTVLAALALWAVLAGMSLPGLEASIGVAPMAATVAGSAASVPDPGQHATDAGALLGLTLSP